MLSPAHFGWAEGIEGFGYDPEKARELIAGLDTAPDMELGLATSPVFDQRVVQAIQQMLTDVGLNVAINTTDMATWLKDQQTAPEQAPMLTFSRWSCACQDPDGIMYPLLHSSSNWSRVNDPEIDAMLDEARSELDEAKRRRSLCADQPAGARRGGHPAALSSGDHLRRCGQSRLAAYL